MNNLTKTGFFALILNLATVGLNHATEGGLTLLQSPGARSSAMANAFSAVTNDVEALSFNPASLATLKQSHASFSYEKGFADDAYGQFLLGMPRGNKGFGLTVGYYNGGTLLVGEEGAEQTINVQRDLLVGFSLANRWDIVSFGFSGKYISSELAETDSAKAFAVDLGGQLKISNDLNFGASLQNLGNKLKYQTTGDDLPRIARIGMNYKMFLIDVPYHINQRAIEPAVGMEIPLKGLIVRGGYKKSSSGGDITMGTGFAFGLSSLDYAFGMAKNGFATHRVSFSMKFAPLPTRTAIVHVIEAPAVEAQAEKTELQKDVEKLAPELKDMPLNDLKAWLRANRVRFKLGDLYKSRAEWEKIYQKYQTVIEQK